MSEGAHVLDLVVGWALWKLVRRQHSVTVEISIKFRHHSKVIDKDWVLVNVLKQAELAILQTQFDSILEIFVCIDNTSLFIFSSNSIPINDLNWNVYRLVWYSIWPHFYLTILTDWDMWSVFKSCCLVTVFIDALSISLPLFFKIKIALNVWPVESREVLINVPFEFSVAQVKDAFCMRSIKVKSLIKGLVLNVQDIWIITALIRSIFLSLLDFDNFFLNSKALSIFKTKVLVVRALKLVFLNFHFLWSISFLFRSISCDIISLGETLRPWRE